MFILRPFEIGHSFNFCSEDVLTLVRRIFNKETSIGTLRRKECWNVKIPAPCTDSLCYKRLPRTRAVNSNRSPFHRPKKHSNSLQNWQLEKETRKFFNSPSFSITPNFQISKFFNFEFVTLDSLNLQFLYNFQFLNIFNFLIHRSR